MNPYNCPPPPPGPQTQSPASATPATFCTLNQSVTVPDAVVTARVPAIADGIYSNATITVAGGCISAISSGNAVLYSECDPCAGTTPTPPPVTITVDPDPCNLTSNGPNGLLSRLFTTNSSCMTISGCGTLTSPLQVNPIISPTPGNGLTCTPNGLYVAAGGGGGGGVNYTGCGITVSNGLITALPLPYQPVLEIAAEPGCSITVQRDPGNLCKYIIGNCGSTDPFTFVLVKGTRQYDTVGDLPADPSTTGFYFAAVGTTNPRSFYAFVDGLGWKEVQDSASLSLRITL